MADTLETQADRLVGGDIRTALEGIERAPTGVLRRALEFEQLREGGGRPTVTASLRHELRRRGSLRRSAAQRGEMDLELMLVAAAFLVFAIIAFGQVARAAQWGGMPALRFSWFPSAAECSSDGDLVRPQLEQPLWRDGPTRVYGVLEHSSCLGEIGEDSADDRIGVTLEVQL